MLLALAHAAQQALQGVLWTALIVVAAALAGAVAAWRWLWPRTGPRRLRLTAEGSITVQLPDGSWRAVGLQPGSIRLGDWLLLHLKATDGCSFRLVLGPDNLPGQALATLRRRLRRPPTAAGPLL